MSVLVVNSPYVMARWGRGCGLFNGRVEEAVDPAGAARLSRALRRWSRQYIAVGSRDPV